MSSQPTVGVIGGTGQLGGAIARALLRSGTVAPARLWISSRTGATARFEAWDGIRFTMDNRALMSACDVVLLSVPPALAPEVGIDATGRLLVSVMAGVTVDRLAALTGAERVVRAMSSPAAEQSLAYSPWFRGPGASKADGEIVRALFTACGLTDEVFDEGQIDLFTALTGPVPGLVAYLADCMVRHAVARGAEPQVADRAVRQLFLASGTEMAQSSKTPADHVREMIAYAGTTAAGLEALLALPVAEGIAAGLDAAIARARAIAADG
jgi:pyrroline-5-carboxylate reductase